MITLNTMSINIPDDSGRMLVTFGESYTWKSKRGKEWTFPQGWSSDGHSIPGPFKNFDRLTMAAFCHDIDCESALDFKQRRQGDKDYYLNMREMGGAMYVAITRYLGVSVRSYQLRMRGKIDG